MTLVRDDDVVGRGKVVDADVTDAGRLGVGARQQQVADDLRPRGRGQHRVKRMPQRTAVKGKMRMWTSDKKAEDIIWQAGFWLALCIA